MTAALGDADSKKRVCRPVRSDSRRPSLRVAVDRDSRAAVLETRVAAERQSQGREGEKLDGEGGRVNGPGAG